MIRDNRLRRRCSRGFANSDTNSRQRKDGDVLRHPAKRCHRAPERERDRHDVASVGTVRETRDGHAEQRVKQHKTEAGEQAHRGVGELELALDRLDQHIENRAIEEIQSVDQRQQDEDVISVCRGCARFSIRNGLLLKCNHRSLSFTFPEPRAAKSTQAAQACLRCGSRDPEQTHLLLDPGSHCASLDAFGEVAASRRGPSSQLSRM